MKILSWNVRGLGTYRKRAVIKEFLKVYQPDIVMLQETKSDLCDRSSIKSIWGSHFCKWDILPSCGRSGGI